MSKLYRVRAQLNFYSRHTIKWLLVKDYIIDWCEEERGTKLTEEEALAVINLLRTHGGKSHTYELVEVEPAYLLKTSGEGKDYYYNSASADFEWRTTVFYATPVTWTTEIDEVTTSFDKTSALMYQQSLRMLFDIDTELVEYYEHR